MGLIAGSGSFPFHFVAAASQQQHPVFAICHRGETDPALEKLVKALAWIKVGELGAIIQFFKSAGIKKAAMAGGISRVKLFGGVKLDARGALLIARLRSTKDDVIMRGVAEELQKEGIEIVPAHLFMPEQLIEEGVITRARPSQEELEDIQVGLQALEAMSSQDIGQLVVVKAGVITAVEAVEGSDEAILRGGELARRQGGVVVKFPKVTQDLRFDLPAVGIKTVETMVAAGCRVLALEAGKSLVFDREQMIELANKHNIAILGCRRQLP